MALFATRNGIVGGNTALLPTRSLSFVSASSQYLSISHGNFANYNRAKYAISLWFKRAASNLSGKALFSKGDSSNSTTEFYLQFISNKIQFVTYSSVDGTPNGELKTTETYTDTLFHHLMVHFDSANSTAGDRMRMWVDGSEITSFTTDTNPTASTATANTKNANIGAVNGFNNFDGLIFQPALFSGYLPTIGEVYNSGMRDVTSITGLSSLLNTNATDALEDDYVLSTNWTNNGTVTKSSTIP